MSDDAPKEATNSLYTAIARTLTRSIALYFSRPVRLFRPSKISGWHSLRGLASREGASLTPQFVTGLVKAQGFMVIPKHFVPPLVVNAVLGTVLWTSYAEASSLLEPQMAAYPIVNAALSGAIAGGSQAIIAAPAENLRLAIEGGSAKSGGWSHAWKEVFRGTAPARSDRNINVRNANLEDIRQIRTWMRDVRDMAGRGWDGWGWGLAKDIFGFAAFFSIFEVTRWVATNLKLITQNMVQHYDYGEDHGHSVRRHAPRVVHGVALVSGGAFAGLSYEIMSRPWDAARRAVYLDRIHSNTTHTARHFAVSVLLRKVRADGFLSLFRNPEATSPDHHGTSSGRRRIRAALRTLARVGPWGVGFLVWEAMGPGIS